MRKKVTSSSTLETFELWRFKLGLHGWISNKVEQCECNYETAFKDHILRFLALAPIFAEDKCFCLVWDAYISLWEEGRWLVLPPEFSWWTVLQVRKPLHLEMLVTFVIWFFDCWQSIKSLCSFRHLLSKESLPSPRTVCSAACWESSKEHLRMRSSGKYCKSVPDTQQYR